MATPLGNTMEFDLCIGDGDTVDSRPHPSAQSFIGQEVKNENFSQRQFIGTLENHG